MLKAQKLYQKISVESEVHSASPHRLVQMLFEGCLQRIALAKVHIDSHNIPEKIRCITKALDIIVALRASLKDKETLSLSQQLDNLYAFAERQLVMANLENSTKILDDVYTVISTIKAGWDAIGEEVQQKVAVNE